MISYFEDFKDGIRNFVVFYNFASPVLQKRVIPFDLSLEQVEERESQLLNLFCSSNSLFSL